MNNPLFWLGLSILLVAVSLTVLLVAAIPALQELARAARSAEKLFDTLSRELPPTLDAIRMTGLELTDLSDDVSESVRVATDVVKQVDHSLDGARKQAENLQVGTRSFMVGVKTAWKTFTRPQGLPRANSHLDDDTDTDSLNTPYSEYESFEDGYEEDGDENDSSFFQPQLSPSREINSPKPNLDPEIYEPTYPHQSSYDEIENRQEGIGQRRD